MSSVFDVHVAPALAVVGTAITHVALTGGAWAVLASDFVQMLLVVTITLTAAFLALRVPAVGGLRGLIRQVPHAYFHPPAGRLCFAFCGRTIVVMGAVLSDLARRRGGRLV